MAALLSKGLRVAVVGAGIVGASSALCIKEIFPEAHVSILSYQFSPNTTSDKAGGLITPAIGLREQKWFTDSYKHYKQLACSSEAPEAGVSLTFGYTLDSSPGPWFYQDTVVGWRTAPEEERRMMNLPDLKTWMFYGTFLVNCSKYLSWLMCQFINKDGVVVRMKVNDLEELLSSFDIVVNCSGLSARELTEDSSLQPVWGQGRLVKAPWVKYFVHMEFPQYKSLNAESFGSVLVDSVDILPRCDGLYVGGIKVWGKEYGAVEDGYRRQIQQRVEEVMPSLSNAPTVKEWTGIRPFRKTVKVSVEKNTQGKHIIHNYGHGGYGITLSWGCALEVVSFVKDILTTSASAI